MTVNELIAELERERAAGHGDIRVVIWMPDNPPYWRDPMSILYRRTRLEGAEGVEIV
jgi:hypothetical protein